MSNFTFELDERDKTPQWISAEYLVQVTEDGEVVAFTCPNEDYDDYDELDLTHETDPVLIEMVRSAREYITSHRDTM